MSAIVQALETAMAAAHKVEARIAELQTEIASLRVGTAPTEPPTTIAALPESISLAQAAKKFGLTFAQARELFATVTPEEAAEISRCARMESERAARENERRQARRSGQ